MNPAYDSAEARTHRYDLLRWPAPCVHSGCEATATVWVRLSSTDNETGYSGCYCNDHAAEGVEIGLRFVKAKPSPWIGRAYGPLAAEMIPR